MVDPISAIRQMMAESKFYEAFKTVEMHLSVGSGTERKDLLPIYLELLELQDKKLPEDLVVETAEFSIDEDPQEAIKWLEKLPEKVSPQNFRRIQILKIKIAEKKGRLYQLYSLISELKLRLFENRVPARMEYIDSLILKYFKQDFHLKLQDLALGLMLGDNTRAEEQIRELISSCTEKAASTKGTREKLIAIAEIIKTYKEKKQLEIYQSYCFLSAHGVSEKSEYKKLAEMIIYFDDFKFQLLVLDLLEKLGLPEVAAEYATTVRENSGYDFVHIEKYFGHLKKYFPRIVRPQATAARKETEVPDYTLERPISPLPATETSPEPLTEEETLIISSLKYQNYLPLQLIELAISFLHSNYLRAAAFAAEKAMNETTVNQDYLKAAYLRATCLFQLEDFRAALDLSLESLNRAEVQDDILSFLYLQAEAYARLKLKKEARRALKKILSIDSRYRLTRERLERLDEI